MALGSTTAAAVSPDERWIAVAAADHAIRLFNLQTGTPALTLQGHTETVAALRFTADSTHLLSGSADRSLKVWKMADGRWSTSCLPAIFWACNRR